MSAEVQERLGIRVTEVREESLAISLAVAGSVQPIESRVARVRPLARGRVLEVRTRIGDRVERGAELARFDNVEAGAIIKAIATLGNSLNMSITAEGVEDWPDMDKAEVADALLRRAGDYLAQSRESV